MDARACTAVPDPPSRFRLFERTLPRPRGNSLRQQPRGRAGKGVVMRTTKAVENTRSIGSLLVCSFFAITLAATAARAQTLTVYDDALENGFADYSYGGGTNFADTA